LLTVDHVFPSSKGGSDDIDNLVYCCFRCNQYKAAYWPSSSNAVELWNPRRDPKQDHFLELANGDLYAITPKGAATIDRLRLNRPDLIEHRLRVRMDQIRQASPIRNDQLMASIEQTLQQLVLEMQEQRVILREQNRLLKILRKRKPK
jgi:hypothetical protein